MTNQVKQTKNPKGVSLVHLVTPPTTFQMITKQWASCKALAVSREESTHPEAVPSQPPQLPPCSARTDLPTSETSSNPQQFHGVGCEGQDLAKESHTVRVQAFPMEHRMLRRAARDSSSTSLVIWVLLDLQRPRGKQEALSCSSARSHKSERACKAQ